ncbi:coiled-coil domain-containing protein 14 [Perognathus longimembris pacificus]|uniref:coiled-coil domain-containing protein 14 n=1 Tax=Perognathus longimembris pacificus TaxID=214514 RepID=UPI0020191E06|nr:coiled-coil domain-containing protein 14 [Perognathus longimembris pacificus]
MKRAARRAPYRKRKKRGRAKGDRKSTAVNSIYRAAFLLSVCVFLRLRAMVRSGSRPGQVLSSGRPPGSARITHGKKGTHLRKVSHLNADSGHPVYSDSEGQIEPVRGLDGCASLLRDILKNEDSGSEAVYSENRCNSRPLESKKCDSKQKRREKYVPSVVRKEILSSDNKKQIPKDALTRSEKDTSDMVQNWSLQDHYRMYSPIIYQALCEHVQTQMSLMNNLASKKSPNGTPAVCGPESQATPLSNCGLCTSTPTRSPQRPSCLPMVHSEVQTDDNNKFAPQDKTASVNYPDIPRNSFNNHRGVQCSLPQNEKADIATFQQLNLANWILPQPTVSEEADLLKCFQTHMSLFPSCGKESVPDIQTCGSLTHSQPAFLATSEERCAREQVGEATNEGKYLNIHVQDAKIVKDVQKAKNVNQTAEKVRTINYLLGELKALVSEQEDSEIQRLVAELEACISGLLAKSGNTNTQIEIALAMQPLKSENAHLQRQLKILNQRLKEQEITAKASSTMKCNLELFSLQSLNMSLQNQLQELMKSQELLQSKNEELLKVIENQKDENKKFTSLFKDKDQTLLENKQQFDIEMTRIKIELEEALVNVKNSQFKLETAEKENQILGITLRQRDAEVTRLRELTRTLQNSMAKLLSDLSVDTARCKPGNNLTKSLLNIYDKQLEQNPAPLHTSIMSYLNKLETNNSFAHSELLSTIKNEETIDLNSPYENVLPPKGLPHSDTRAMEGISVPENLCTLSQQGSDTECETMTLIEGYNLDNTVYIPLARSTSKKHSPLPQRVSPQPKISVATTQLVSNSTLISESKNKLCAPVVDSSKNEAEDVHPNLSRTADMEDIQLLKKIKEAIDKIPVATEDTKDQTAHHSPAACHATSVQGKGKANAVCNASFLHSDLMSDWSISSFSTFTSRDEQDFRNGLAALDANIARLQKSLRTGLLEK